MSVKSKKWLVILICIVGALILLYVGTRINYRVKVNKAIQAAKGYLAEKYEGDMIYLSTFYFLPEELYTVKFYPENDPDYIFEVYVGGGSSDFSAFRDTFNE